MRLACKLMFDITQDLDVRYYEDYAEPGYFLRGKLGIFAADWNLPIMKRIGDILEKLGYVLDWSDELTDCGECYRAIRTCADCYQWEPYFTETKNSLVCLDCANDYIEEIIEIYKNRARLLPSVLSLDDTGYELSEASLESGFHQGMDANPKEIIKRYNSIGYDVLFRREDTSQFYVTFDVYIKSMTGEGNE